MMRQILLLFALSTAAFGQARTPSPAKKAIPKPSAVDLRIPNTDDIEPVIRRFVALGSASKGEFETQAQFETRLRTAVVRPDKQYAFIYDQGGPACVVGGIATNQNCDFEYDADRAVMKAYLAIKHRMFKAENGTLTDKVPCVLIKDVQRSTQWHVGQNSFGAKLAYTSRLEDEFGIVISQEAAAWLGSFQNADNIKRKGLTEEEATMLRGTYPDLFHPTFTFPLGPEQAQRMKPSLRTVLLGTIPDGRVYVYEDYDAATVSDPIELTVDRFCVNFEISEVRIVESRTGSTVAAFKRPEQK
jgi:hypothetical protein